MNSEAETNKKVTAGWAVIGYQDVEAGCPEVAHIYSVWDQKANADEACERLENDHYFIAGGGNALVQQVEIIIKPRLIDRKAVAR